jgi:hypothetical protein
MLLIAADPGYRSCVLRAVMRKAGAGFNPLLASRRGGDDGGAAGAW